MEDLKSKLSLTPTCPTHNVNLLTCTEENCSKTVCRLCAVYSKDELSHLTQHFESLKEQLPISLDEYKNKIKVDEFYGDLNKAYGEFIDSADNSLSSIYDKLSIKKQIISDQVNTTLLTKYEELTVQFEVLVKSLSEKLNTISTHDNKAKDDFRKIKKELDEKLSFLTNPSIFSKDFIEFLTKVDMKLRKLKIDDILNDKFNFSYKMSLCNLEWENTNSPILNVVTQGSSYWSARSKEMLEGAFSCKIAIRAINDGYVGSYWNYTCGLARPNITSDSSYYNDCLVFQSNGYIASEFSGSGSHKQLFFNNWKVGDEILIKREENGNVFFGLNNETSYQLGFSNKQGQMRIVMGFSTSMSIGSFEIVELIKE
jgi:predicted DNA-binding protein YlxM (UPF0122 family)